MRRSLIRITLFTLLTASGLLFAAAPARAQIIIRDTEIENTLKEWTAPIFKAAKIDPNGVHLILVQDNELNSFVAGGSNIFIYTGLILKTEDPGELIGVLAHETGHIAGGHLIGSREAMEKASYESIIGMLLGVGAAIASGDAGAIGALGGGAQDIAARRYLSYSRMHESSADQAALTFLEDSGESATGLVSFMKKLEDEELVPANQQDPYVRTHPLTRDRVEALEARAKTLAHYDQPWPAKWVEEHARMKAKLLGFINPGQVAWTYDDRDTSIAARYARAIADYRQSKIDKALAEIDALLADEPKNPYFYELKGQMLVEFNRVDQGIPAYKKAVELLPDAALLRIALGHALLESENTPQNRKEAINNLERALADEDNSPQLHHLLATAYGRDGDEPMAKYHLAEEAFLQRKIPFALQQLDYVLKTAKPGSKAARRAQDLKSYIDSNAALLADESKERH